MSRATNRRAALQDAVDRIPFWFHSIDLGEGLVTPGHKTPEIHLLELSNQRWPDLHGKSVLDIGTWDGFYAFEAERRGAARVVALDQFAWSNGFLPEVDRRAFFAALGTAEPELSGKAGFDLVHAARHSRVEAVVGDFSTMDLHALGEFDVVLFLGVLYHLPDPLGALTRLRAVTREVAIIETQASVLPGWEGLSAAEFFDGAQLAGDPTNWWSPTPAALHGLCRAAGFGSVEDTAGPPPHPLPSWPPQPVRYRHTLHARPEPLGPRVPAP